MSEESLETLRRDPTAESSSETAARTPGAPPRRSGKVGKEASRFAAGTLIAERYRVVSGLGKGGMGEVYRADDLKLGVPVALKFLPVAHETASAQLALLFEEVKIARQISHPNVCRVYDLGEAEGVHFLSMEYIDGEDLRSLLHRIGRLPWDKAIEIGRQLCQGLAAAHDAGVLHRDLKPANVMIDGDGRARITDFGLAAVAEDLAGGDLAGTPLYMAPEQFDRRPATVASDLYALGLVLAELFTGRRVFSGSSLEELGKLHRETAPTPPSRLREGFDPALERAILRCLEKDPSRRPGSAAEIEASLVEAVGPAVSEGAQVATLVVSQLVGPAGEPAVLTDDSAIRAHDRKLRDLLDEHEGREIARSDGFLSLFPRPLHAVRFALDYHGALEKLGRELGTELVGRVAIHLGEVVVRQSRARDVERGARPLEVEGLARTTVSRLATIAVGRQTLVSQTAFDLARRGARGEIENAESLRWLAHGDYELAQTDETVAVYEVGVEGVAPLTAPEGNDEVQRVGEQDVIPGWRPAAGLAIPLRPNWAVERKLGEGGFGEVWLGAHRKTHETRVYKFCFDADRLRSLQREITVFRLLKEELGQRDDVARVLDWNLDESPYFIEFHHTEGGSLTDWAKARGGIHTVPLENRLELVAQVATALAAAHSVGVLHKDVKPENVLVETDSNGRPRAVLTDFGIGLITERERLAAKGITVMGLSEMDAADEASAASGTRIYLAPELLAGQPATIQADIFALGVLLYQVIVGDLAKPMAQGWKRHVDDELLREEIAAMVDGSPARRPAGAAEVATRLRRLEERRAERDAKERAARAAERARKRRRLATTVAATASVFLVVVSLLAIQAVRARGDAERRRAQAEQLIDFMLNDLYEGLDRIGRLDLLEEVARSSQRHFDSLNRRDETPEALYQRGMTLQNIGQVLLEEGDAGAARAAQETAIALFESGVAREPMASRWRRGESLGRLGLGDALRAQGDTETALESYRAALATARQLAAEDPTNRDHQFAMAQSHYRLAFLQRRIGNDDACLEEAAAALRLLEPLTAEADADWRHHLLRLETHKLLARSHRFNGSFDLALAESRRAQDLARRLQVEDPGNAYWPRMLAWSHSEIGILLLWTGEPEKGLAAAREAVAAYRTLVLTDPTRTLLRESLAFALQLEASLLAALGNPVQALALLQEATGMLETLVDGDPEHVDWLRQLAFTHQLTGQLHQSEGRLSAAIESQSAAVELHGREAAITDDAAPRNEVAWNRVLLGDLHLEAGDSASAREQWSRAVDEIEPITAASQSLQFLDTHAQALMRLGRVEESRPMVEKLLAAGWADPGFLQQVQRSGLETELP